MADPERPAALPEQGTLELRTVDFAYGASPDDDPETLEERRVLEGWTSASKRASAWPCVGPTGGGKSTLAKLAGRLYDPLAGSVRFGGVDLRTAMLASIRERIVVLPQEGFLFRGTVLENVALGRPGATDDEAREAIAKLGLSELGQQPSRGRTDRRGGAGFAPLRRRTPAGEPGPGGPHGPAVLIMDEATSSIDPGTERQAEEALAAWRPGARSSSWPTA